MCYRKGNQDNPTLGHLRDQSVFITWGGPEDFRGGDSLEIGLPKGGVYSLEDFVEGGGGVQLQGAIKTELFRVFAAQV